MREIPVHQCQLFRQRVSQDLMETCGTTHVPFNKKFRDPYDEGTFEYEAKNNSLWENKDRVAFVYLMQEKYNAEPNYN